MSLRPILRGGLPAVTDVTGQYRLHIDMVANGERPRPVAAVLVEFQNDGTTIVRGFGPAEATSREQIQMLAKVNEAVAGAIVIKNADASN